MSKLYVIPVVLALLALMAVPAMAEVVTDSASADVTLTIEKYCEIAYDGTSFDITVSGGGDYGEDTHTYSISANFRSQVNGTLTAPTDAPGTWRFYLKGEGMGWPVEPQPILFRAGTYNGAVRVVVTEIGLGDGNGVWDTDGTMVIDISEQ